VVRHPLQPFDIKNVEHGKLIPDQPFTFDPIVLRAARAASGERAPRQPFISAPLSQLPSGDVELADVLRFFKHPVEGFFRELDYTLPWEVDGVEDAMPVEIDPLQQWSIGDRLVRDLLREVDLEVATTAERLRGTLPPGRLGERKALGLSEEAAELAMAALKYQSKSSTAYDVNVDLGDGRRLTGTVTPVFRRGLVAVTYSRLAAKHLLQSWISLVALGAAGHEYAAACIGRGDRGDIKARVFGLPPDPPAVLRDLVTIFDAGRREPLPLPLRTSCGWAEKRHRRRDPVAYARNKWEEGVSPENADRAHVRIWGADAKLKTLLEDRPRPGEEVDGEDSRLGALATRLWLPVLDAERRID
jgi:exodeoxyribonuclease V gamma subunit